ncbi:unnamed protein product, partial [Owenia fusiformis]
AQEEKTPLIHSDHTSEISNPSKNYQTISGHFKAANDENEEEVSVAIKSYGENTYTEGLITDETNAKHWENTNNVGDHPNGWKERVQPTMLIATLQLCLDVKMLLIIPLSMLNGTIVTFIFGEFTQAYVACSQGIWMVGYFVVAFGVAFGLISMVIGRVKAIGRLAATMI